ncbi:hypothetical protein [Capnocytophaga endodontalis]|uniref:Uncharacterized protein n=1 Tax=Capnocytophaga endodontalis TaxID=2708117 RepID=A0A1Z4BNG8_9FLAO|nr:hypothetical protein [Capnocytophaga endodontalis]ASF42849.1 hypothetical protein CBG49_07035 [Capnocytophaga endodontalis]
MKKLGLLFLLIGTFFSCQKKEDGYLEDPYKGKLKVTYIEEAKGWVKNIALHNEDLYFIRQDPFIGKMDSKGNTSSVTVTKSDNFNFNNDGSSVALSDSGDVYYTKGLLGPHKIFKYTPSTQQTTEIKVKYNPSYFEGREGILALTRYNSNEFMFFDFVSKTIKRYFHNLGTIVDVIGSGRDEISDGTGINASFRGISQMTVFEKNIYVIDGENSIRKIEPEGTSFKVTTLLRNYPETIKDLATDDNGVIYVVAHNQGILKFNPTTNQLEDYLSGKYIEMKTPKSGLGYNDVIFNVDAISIKGKDMYLAYSTTLIKIANFKEEIAKYLLERERK